MVHYSKLQMTRDWLEVQIKFVHSMHGDSAKTEFMHDVIALKTRRNPIINE